MKLLCMFAAVCAFLATSLVAGVAGTEDDNFVLSGNQHMDVTTPYMSGTLHDYSTADVTVTGGLEFALVHDSSIMNISGVRVRDLYAYETSVANISGGSVQWMESLHNSVTNVSDGSVSNLHAEDTSIANISGGSVQWMESLHNSVTNVSDGSVMDLGIYNTGKANISGGYVNYARVCGGVANISGGSVSSIYTEAGVANISGGSVDALSAFGTGVVNVTGGSVDWMEAYGGNITFYGYDFQATDGLSLDGQRVVGTGILTGKWFDGTSWATTISLNDTGTMIQVVPEPSSLLALFFGIGGIGGMVWRRKR